MSKNIINSNMNINEISDLIGKEGESLLSHTSKTIDKSLLHLPGPDFVNEVFGPSNRSPQVLRSLGALYGNGRLANTGYLSILPVDQGVEHSAGASFAKNPIYFDGENIVKLAVEGGCNAVASTFGVLASVSRKYAHKIPFIVKINHNELMTFPNTYDQIMFGSIKSAWDMGAVAVGATIYFGSEDSNRQIIEVAEAFEYAHDLTAQANHLGVTLQADIIKQKLPENNGGYLALNTGDSSYGKLDKRIYTELTSDNPIDLTRYQVANCFMGRQGLINSGGASSGDSANDLSEALRTAVINKRAGGTGLISGRKAFQKPMNEGVQLLNAIQDVYLEKEITIA
jgi:class I fructose-bisphosphate aldolase